MKNFPTRIFVYVRKTRTTARINFLLYIYEQLTI